MQILLVSGAAAGAAFGIFLIAADSTGPTPVSIVSVFVLLAAVGALVGATQIAAVLAARRVSRQLPARWRTTTALAISTATLLSPACFLFATAMLNGRYARTLPAHGLLVGLGTTVLCGLVLAAVWGGLRLGPGLLAASRRCETRVFWLVVALMAAATGLLALERNWLVRRYDPIHAALSLGAFLFLQLAFLAVLQVLVRRLPRLSTGIVGLLLAAGAVVAFQVRTPERSDLRRTLVSAGFVGDQLLDLVLFPGASADEPPLPRPADRFAPSATTAVPARLGGADVVLVTVDALRADHLGLHGYHRPTSPVLDGLGQRAIVFERAYAPTPHTSFSLTSLLTGRHGWSLGRARKLDGLPTLADVYRRAGYRTVGLFPPAVFFVESELFAGYERRHFGFEHAESRAYEETADATTRTDRAIAWMEAVGPRPLFLWVHYFGPHEPYVHHPALGSPPFGRRDLDRYDEEIRQVDRELGRLLDHVTRKRPGAIVVVTADHGEEFGEHGGSYHGTTLFDEQLRVPLIIAAPGLAARRVATPVSTVDVVPTLLELTGVAGPPALDGSSLTGLMTGAEASEPRNVFAELDGLKMLRRQDHKLLCDVTRDFCQLYDLAHDPRERRDIAERLPALREELRSTLLTWLRRSPEVSHRPSASQSAAEDLLERAARFETEAIARLGDLLATGPGGPQFSRPIRLRAAELMARLPQPGKAAALTAVMVRDADADVRAWAAIGLGLDGRTDAAEAIASLRVPDGDRVKRGYRALALHRTGHRRAIAEMLSVLPSVDEVTLRCGLIQALGDSKYPAAGAALEEAYPIIRSRICVARAFAALESAASLPFLESRLREEPYSHVRAALAEAIARSDKERAIPVLRDLFRNETEELVSATTARLLVQLGAGLPVARRKPLAVPPEARELWLVPNAAAGAPLRIRLRDAAGRRTARRIETEPGREAYAFVLPDAASGPRATRAFAPDGHVLFR